MRNSYACRRVSNEVSLAGKKFVKQQAKQSSYNYETKQYIVCKFTQPEMASIMGLIGEARA